MIGNDKGSYPVKGNVEYIPSKLSESIGTRVYSKLKKPYGIFFRNPSMAGIYSENLEPGEIEFVFSVRDVQIPFIGGIKILILIPGETGYLSIQELPKFSYEYSLMSKDLSCNFNDISDIQSRRHWDIDWDIDTPTDKLYENLQGNADDEEFKEKDSMTTYYRFRLWLEQRRKAYYEGYKCNKSDPIKYDPYSWNIYINPKEEVCFNEIKLELAKEYWWMQRIGFVKLPIIAASNGTLDFSDQPKDVKEMIEVANNNTNKELNNSELSYKIESITKIATGRKSTNCIVKMNGEDYYAIALTYDQLTKKITTTVSQYNSLRTNSESKVYKNIGQENFTGALSYDMDKSKSGKDIKLKFTEWPLTKNDGKSMPVEDIYKTIIVFDKESLAPYQDYYFMSSDNDDDNNELINAYKSTFFENNQYEGGIKRVDNKNYLNNMLFKRPFDRKPKHYNELLEETDKYKQYKCKIKMKTPGELYYIGVMLLHKQYMLTGSEKGDEVLNSDIVVSSMISRPNVPDWVDDGGTMKDFLKGFPTSDKESVTNLFYVGCLNNPKDSGLGNYGNFANNSNETLENFNIIRQVAGLNYSDIKNSSGKLKLPDDLGDVWHIGLTEGEAEQIKQIKNDKASTSITPFKPVTAGDLTNEGVIVLKGRNTRSVEIGLIWTLKTAYTEESYEAGYECLPEKSQNLKINNFDNCDVYIQAPYYNYKNYKTIHYIKLLRSKNYTIGDNKNLVDIDDYGKEDGKTNITAVNKDKLIDTVELSIQNRIFKDDSKDLSKTDLYDVKTIFDKNDESSSSSLSSSLIRINTHQFENRYSLTGDTDSESKNIIPMYELNKILFQKQQFILASNDDKNNIDDKNKPYTNKEIYNRMVRKFYIFYAEMIENDYKMSNEPLDISNRDWVNDTITTDINDLNKFSKARKYVIKRFNNDGILPSYTLKYEQWSVYENINNAPSKESSTKYFTRSKEINGKHGCVIIPAKHKEEYGKDEIKKDVDGVAEINPIEKGIEKEIEIEGVIYYKVEIGKEPNKTSLWLSLNHFDKVGENSPEDRGFRFDGTNITRKFDNTSTGPMGIICNESDLYGVTIKESLNGKVVAVKNTLDDKENKKYIINDLTFPMNTKYNDIETPGTRHYRCSYGGSKEKVQIYGADCYLMRDVITIVDPTFETAKQRCYCICSVIETDDPAMNFWTYTNQAEYYSAN